MFVQHWSSFFIVNHYHSEKILFIYSNLLLIKVLLAELTICWHRSPHGIMTKVLDCMEIQNIWSVIWLSFIGYCLLYLTSFVFFLLHLTHWHLLCLWSLQRNYWRKEERRWGYLSSFNFILDLMQLLCREKMSSWTIRKQSHLPNKVLKCISHFWLVISPKLVVLSSWYFLWDMYVSC